MDDEDDVKAHVLGNKWRHVKDESERLFDNKREKGYDSLAPELRRAVMRCHRHSAICPLNNWHGCWPTRERRWMW